MRTASARSTGCWRGTGICQVGEAAQGGSVSASQLVAPEVSPVQVGEAAEFRWNRTSQLVSPEAQFVSGWRGCRVLWESYLSAGFRQRLSSLKFERLTSSVGIVPVNWFPQRCSSSQVGEAAEFCGNRTCQLVSPRLSSVKFERLTSSVGIVPVNWFPRGPSDCRLERLPSSVGIVPVSWFSQRLSSVKFGEAERVPSWESYQSTGFPRGSAISGWRGCRVVWESRLSTGFHRGTVL